MSSMLEKLCVLVNKVSSYSQAAMLVNIITHAHAHTHTHAMNYIKIRSQNKIKIQTKITKPALIQRKQLHTL